MLRADVQVNFHYKQGLKVPSSRLLIFYKLQEIYLVWKEAAEPFS